MEAISGNFNIAFGGRCGCGWREDRGWCPLLLRQVGKQWECNKNLPGLSPPTHPPIPPCPYMRPMLNTFVGRDSGTEAGIPSP